MVLPALPVQKSERRGEQRRGGGNEAAPPTPLEVEPRRRSPLARTPRPPRPTLSPSEVLHELVEHVPPRRFASVPRASNRRDGSRSPGNGSSPLFGAPGGSSKYQPPASWSSLRGAKSQRSLGGTHALVPLPDAHPGDRVEPVQVGDPRGGVRDDRVPRLTFGVKNRGPVEGTAEAGDGERLAASAPRGVRVFVRCSTVSRDRRPRARVPAPVVHVRPEERSLLLFVLRVCLRGRSPRVENRHVAAPPPPRRGRHDPPAHHELQPRVHAVVPSSHSFSSSSFSASSLANVKLPEVVVVAGLPSRPRAGALRARPRAVISASTRSLTAASSVRPATTCIRSTPRVAVTFAARSSASKYLGNARPDYLGDVQLCLPPWMTCASAAYSSSRSRHRGTRASMDAA